MINMTTPQAKTTLNLMTQFRAMGRPWRMDEWDYIITRQSFLNYDDAIDYLNRFIAMDNNHDEDIIYDV
jgi:hypothetical protein